MSKIIPLAETDGDKTINCNKDDRVVVSLPWRPSSGFFWQDTDTTVGILEQIKHSGEDPLPGAIAVVTFKFHILQSGIIKLSYARPWSETQPPNKWFEVKVQI